MVGFNIDLYSHVIEIIWGTSETISIEFKFYHNF